MANNARAVLEDALRAKRLDRTLTTAQPLVTGEHLVVPTDVAALDARLAGGLPRGQLSEIVGPRSSGRTLLLLQTLAAATRRGEIAALVDTFDRLDVASVISAGVDLDRLLWIRGYDSCRAQASGPTPQGCLRPEALDSPGARGLGPEAFVERALKALNLILQAGGFGIVALDLADVPDSALRRIPYTTWPRIQRIVEGRDTACVLLAAQPLARSAGGVTLAMTGHATWAGHDVRPRATGLGPQTEGLGLGPEAWSGAPRLTGLDIEARLVSPRRHVEGSARVRCDLQDGPR
jgi:hypothetical protein